MSSSTKSYRAEKDFKNLLKPATNFGKGAWKKVIDLALYLIACALTGTGLLLAHRLPHGQGYAGRMLFLGYDRHEWGEIHTWLAYVGIFLAVVHLLLNWQWLLKVAASKQVWRLAVGVLTGLLVVGAFLLLPIKESTYRHQQDFGQHRGRAYEALSELTR
jgi:hypothetical protein